MFSNLLDQPQNQLLRARLDRLVDAVRQLRLPTREEYQAEVYSQVNAVLSLQNGMTPLSPITAEGPAVVGDLVNNFNVLSQDATDIASELLSTEDSAGRLLNLAASSQNALRQQIREAIFASSSGRFVEAFIHGRNLGDHSASLDFNAGLATLPLVSESQLQATITIGASSLGMTSGTTDALLDDRTDTVFAWNGSRLELILTLPQVSIVNRLKIEMDDYQGLEVTGITSSPDGTYYDDILAALGVRSFLLNGTSGKYSGDFILDFDPRHIKQMRIILEDRIGIENIALRSISLNKRIYGSTATVTSIPILAPQGEVTFTTIERSASPLTAITHQISPDGVHFQNIVSGAIALPGSPFWYRSILDRSATLFEDQESPLVQPSVDPAASPNYAIVTTSGIPLGAGVLERTLVLENVIGPVVLRETPLPQTFRVQAGTIFLSSGVDFAFSGNVLSFSVNQALVTITYRTSALGSAALADLRECYSPYLYEIRFEK